MTKKENNNNLFFICTIFLILSLPLLDNIFGFSDGLGLEIDENRVLAEFPPIRKESGRISGSLIKKFPRRFEKFYNDNFGFRSPIIHLADKINLEDQSSKKYIIGQDNWLFLGEEYNLKSMAGSNLLSNRRIQENSDVIISNWKECEKRGIDYIFVIAPSKYSIYPEYLPKFLAKIRTQKKDFFGNTDQIVQNILKLYPDFPILDLRGALLEEKLKTNKDIYYKTDTHWNGLGASIAYKELLKELNHKYKILPTPAQYKLSEKEIDYGDLTKMSGIKHKYPSPIIDVKINFKKDKVIRIGKKEVIFYKNSKIRVNSKALIHHDSFFDGHLKDLIANSFRKTIFAHRFGKCQIDTELLETKNLSLVIQEMVERRFVVCVKK